MDIFFPVFTAALGRNDLNIVSKVRKQIIQIVDGFLEK